MTNLSEFASTVRGKIRVITLMEACERASLTPIPLTRLHSLAYLGDVLSPVWNLRPFDRVALKTSRAPFFAQFQSQIDSLVLEGLIEVRRYSIDRVAGGVTVNADVELRYNSPHLSPLIEFIERDEEFGPILNYMCALTVAMSRLPDAAIADAACLDASWENPDLANDDLVEFTELLGGSKVTATDRTILMFSELSNRRSGLSPVAQLRLYAAYLAERLKAA